MQSRFSLRCSLAVLAASAVPAFAQEVAPDRPSASDSTFTVAPGTAQIENGLTHAKGGARRSSVEMLGRVGLTRTLELRIGAEPVVRLRNGTSDTGFGDVRIGAKYRFAEETEGRPSMALRPFVKIPSANRPIGSEEVDFGGAFIASKALPGNWTADFNLGFVGLGQPGNDRYRGQAFTSLALGRSVSDRLTLFGELAYRTREENGGPDFWSANFGAIYLVNKRVALDAAIAPGLNSAADDYVVRAGLTVLLGDPR